MEPCADISSIISILAILVTLLIYALTAAREAHPVLMHPIRFLLLPVMPHRNSAVFSNCTNKPFYCQCKIF